MFGLSVSRIKQRIKAAGLEGVSSHGCRIGMAQDLARAKGIEMPAIMQAGGWRSETTVARYTARETAARGAVARFYEQEGEHAEGYPRQDPARFRLVAPPNPAIPTITPLRSPAVSPP